MGAGKSTIGRRLAEVLGWRFVDLDQEIERRTGRSVPEIFQSVGETGFRSVEGEAAREALESTEVVIAPGGGWAAQPRALEGLPADSRTVWLRVSAREAVRRVVGDPVIRPLLEEPDPVAAAERLIHDREPAYRKSDIIVDVDGRDPTDIVDEIRERVKSSNGE
ncbi:MAG: shikimate kinase [Gemmatimonadetes bacterium]|nr:shikimate kinase [Gemmatimonadota bacterium]